MFMHFSIMMIIFKKKGKKLDQESYDNLFHMIENDLRELGYGDVTVNKKMKDLNKILYDILLKMEKSSHNVFSVNEKMIFKYFKEFNYTKSSKYNDFEWYFLSFYKFCFELPLESMLRDALNFKV